MERVSVLVTFYNQENYVDKAIKSVLDQKTDFDVKILVGDDGSSDRTRDVVKKWIEKYPEKIVLYVMDRDSGKHISGFRASRNRLNLLKHVDTEYFIYLDGDDYFDYDGKLQKQVEILDNPENADCIACSHNIDMLYPDGKKIPILSVGLKEGKYNPREYWKSMYFHTDTLLIRSSVIPSIDTKLLENNFNDNLITFCMIQKGNLYYIPESWAVYVQTGDGIWTGGKVVVNHIRNMFLYDLSNQINPSMMKETTHRFRDTWFHLLKMRKELVASELQPYAEEAKNKNMLNSYKWINYHDLSIWQKQILCIKAFCKCWKASSRYVLSRIYRSILRRQ